MFDVALARRRELPRDRGLPAGRAGGAGGGGGAEARDDGLLRPAVSAPLPRPGAGGGGGPDRALGLHRADRRGALARAPARPGDRDRGLRAGAGAVGGACRRRAGRRGGPMGTAWRSRPGARCWRTRGEGVGRRPSSRSIRRRWRAPAAWCRRSGTTGTMRRRSADERPAPARPGGDRALQRDRDGGDAGAEPADPGAAEGHGAVALHGAEPLRAARAARRPRRSWRGCST